MDFISLSRDQALQTLFPHACNGAFMLTNSKDDEAMPNGMRTYGQGLVIFFKGKERKKSSYQYRQYQVFDERFLIKYIRGTG